MTDQPKGTYPKQHDQADEDFFEQYLQGNSRLSEMYQQTQSPAPPERLNQSILAAAKQQARKNHWWTKPGSWAATIAIFSLIGLLAHNTWQSEQDYLQYDQEQQAFPGSRPKAELEIPPQSAPEAVLPAALSPEARSLDAMSPAPLRSKVHPEKPMQRSEKKDTRKLQYKAAPAPVLTLPSKNRLAEQADVQLQEEGLDAIGNLSKIKAKESSMDESQKATMTFGTAREGLSDTGSDAQQWLEKIQQLLNNNQIDEAQQLFIQFRKKHPDYPVDPVILRQLSPY